MSSSVTQGFGLFTIIDNQVFAQIFRWLFIVFTGLEGFWAILLYLIVRNERLDKTERHKDDIDRRLQKGSKYRTPSISSDDQRVDIKSRQLRYLKSDSPRNLIMALDKLKISYHANPDE